MISKNVAVYCSASDGINPDLLEQGEQFGFRLACEGHALIFGGCNMGLMGRVAGGVKRGGGKVLGVIPEVFSKPHQVFSGCDEVVKTSGLRERKSIMQNRADIFVALPGGFGTMDEMVEIITLAIVGEHRKHMIIVNIDGFFDPILRMFETCFEKSFAQEKARSHFSVARDCEGVFALLKQW